LIRQDVGKLGGISNAIARQLVTDEFREKILTEIQRKHLGIFEFSDEEYEKFRGKKREEVTNRPRQ